MRNEGFRLLWGLEFCFSNLASSQLRNKGANDAA